jgi:chorismate--pyruvate lyase
VQTHAPRAIRPWLRDSGSLTRRLQRACPDAFGVRVLRQRWTRPRLHEARVLAMRPGARALVREVHLLCDSTPWVFARTVMPVQTLKGRHRRLAYLGARPLGGLLFANRALKRGEVEAAALGPNDPLYAFALPDGGRAPLWGRRSVFRLGKARLLVSEFFLPALTRNPRGCS